MDYQILGVKRENGEEVTIRIRAADEAGARAIASSQGILVETIAAVSSPGSTDQSHTSGDPYTTVPPTPLQGAWHLQRPSPPAALQMPPYKPILDGARLLSIAGVIAAVLGAIALLITLFEVLAAVTAYNGDPAMIAHKYEAELYAVAGIVFLLVSVVLRMIGAIGIAIRDIAINTTVRDASNHPAQSGASPDLGQGRW